jgi:hypothetical protein
MCSREDNLQERMFFVIKNYCISAAPNRPAEGCNTYKDKWFVIFRYTIQPVSKHIRYTTWFRQTPSRVDRGPYQPYKAAIKEEMLYCLIFLTKAALLAPLPITSFFFEGKLWGSSPHRFNFNFIKGKTVQREKNLQREAKVGEKR